ncbi:MAG: hypothetical protein IKN15_01365 [Bacteroidaceae bacterium]|nr:hypothetical protein [Bacteroidaceae bacterium]
MTQYVVVAQGPYDDTMFIIFCVLVVLAAIFAVLSKIVSRPRNKILGDVGKLIASQQYMMAAHVLQNSNKKQLARELKRIMKNAMKKDKKGIVSPGSITQRNRFRFAYELYLLFVGEVKVRQDFLDGSQLTEEHKYIIEKLKQIAGK